MKILHVLEDYSVHSGGIRTVLKELNQKLNQANIDSYILSSKKEKDDEIFLVETGKPWLYSKQWAEELNEIYIKNNIDIIHIHGVWMYPQYIAAKFAIQHQIPFLLTPHGMYEPFLWNKSKLKKKIYFNLLSKPVFSKADAIHAITFNEKNNLKKLFQNSNIIEIPNLIDQNNFKEIPPNLNEKYILFLGRLDPKKGIDLLIKSFSKINNTGWKLKIAGGFTPYKKELEKLVEEYNLADKVEFLGLVTGEVKNQLYANAFVFVAPSHSEVVGMVNLEAAIFKTPVITTYQTGLNPKWNDNGGILINPKIEELINALNKVTNWSIEERIHNGIKLHNFVINNYSWQNRLKDWKALYENILKK